MNTNLLKELAQKAGIDYKSFDPFAMFDEMDFAELIVRECAEVALRENHEPAECILSHFGLK